MSRKRTQHYCACGCGSIVPSRIDAKTGKDKGQGHRSTDGGFYIAGHGRKISGLKTAKRLAENGHHQAKPIGSTFIDRGYVREKVANQDWKLQHRLVAGVTDPKIHVHHDDEDKQHNLPGNLIPLTPSEHSKLHKARGCPNWAKAYAACIDCGTTERPHKGGGRCERCYMRQRLGCAPKSTRWAPNNDSCTECGTSARKHRGNGLCQRCYGRIWWRNNHG